MLEVRGQSRLSGACASRAFRPTFWQPPLKQGTLRRTIACRLFHAMHPPVLDRIDRGLLSRIQQNNRRPLRDLADDLGISAPTCLRRMRRLESLGVIRGHMALLVAAEITAAARACAGSCSTGAESASK